MKIILPLLLTLVLAAIAWLGCAYGGAYIVFGVVIPYVAFGLFVVGFVYRLIKWGRSAVPFCIPTTCGQQKSLPWIKRQRIDNPSSFAGVVGRMLLEIFLFRSLFRNTKTQKVAQGLGVGSAKWLWLGALVFHWSLLIVLIRHLRYILNPLPQALMGLEGIDGFFEIGLPVLYLSDVALVVALTYLFIRRVALPRVRYISLPNDYFPLFLLLGIVIAGIVMRYVFKVDLIAVKQIALGLVTFKPLVDMTVAPLFYVHLFLVCVLFAYFPWSKLMHSGGLILSPTRNMANNSRRVRHVNPWDHPVDVHTYEEYEDEFRDKMKKAGLPLDAE